MSDQTQHPPTTVTGPEAATRVGQPAGLGRRAAARFVDTLLVAVVNLALIAPVLAGTGTYTGGMNDPLADASTGVYLLITVLCSAVLLGYFTLMEATLGRTLGKMLLRLRTTGPNGRTPTALHALKRNAWTVVGLLAPLPSLEWLAAVLVLAAWVTIAITIHRDTATRHGWHDTFAGGTTVVRTG